MQALPKLAYMGEAALTALTREESAPYVSPVSVSEAKRVSMKTVGGWPIKDDAKEQQLLDNAVASRRHAIKQYADDSKALAERLVALGAEPLAVLPIKLWYSICQASRLYRLSPDADGKVKISIETLSNKVEGWTISIFLVVALIASAGLFAPGVMLTGNVVGGFFSLIPAFGLFFVVCGIVAGVRSSVLMEEASAFGGWIYSMISRAVLLFVLPKSRVELLRTILPEYTEPVTRNNGPALPQATLRLPPLPQSVEAKLKKLVSTDLKIHVAAVGEAIDFLESPAELVINEVKARAADRFENALWGIENLLFDPIIYVEKGSAVAIIDQFGDFPIEKEVIDRLANNPEYLL